MPSLPGIGEDGPQWKGRDCERQWRWRRSGGLGNVEIEHTVVLHRPTRDGVGLAQGMINSSGSVDRRSGRRTRDVRLGVFVWAERSSTTIRPGKARRVRRNCR